MFLEMHPPILGADVMVHASEVGGKQFEVVRKPFENTHPFSAWVQGTHTTGILPSGPGTFQSFMICSPSGESERNQSLSSARLTKT